jgi:putative nucleotidyltransferase with HDIG domain
MRKAFRYLSQIDRKAPGYVVADSPTPHKFHKMELNTKNLISKIPKEVTHVTETLEKAGFEAFLVGGCVRDLIIGRNPKDWDVTTNATPEEIVKLFEKTIYENNFGTVGVCVPVRSVAKEGVTYETEKVLNNDVSRGTIGDNVKHLPDEALLCPPIVFDEGGAKVGETKYEIIEVTPYRIEGEYKDFRRPEEVKFSDNIDDDLKRRDFTINALAFRPFESMSVIKDNFEGLKDINNKVLRTVGNPDERFNEDALRMLRAIRISLEIDFIIEAETLNSIYKNSHLIANISLERIRDEFIKIIMSPNPRDGIVLLKQLNLLKYIIPELEEGIKCEQGGAHKYDVFEHLLEALKHAADKNWPLEIRLSALFHDIGKPRTRRLSNQVGKKKYTFYGHEVIGARMVKKIMERLKFSRKEIDLVYSLVYNHMFFSDTETITLSAVRRIINKVGVDNIWTLMKVRECDRVGMSKVEAPYRLRKYHAMIEEALRDPISVKQLKIDGNYLIKDMNMKPGPRMGYILNVLLEEVLDDPKLNELDVLKARVLELDKLDDKILAKMAESAKETKENLEEQEVEKLHMKHNVKK